MAPSARPINPFLASILCRRARASSLATTGHRLPCVEVYGVVAPPGLIDFEVAASYPLDRVADAFEQVEQRHVRGKVVLLTGGPGR